MPVILRLKGYRFEFFSLDLGEPPHVHVRKDKKSAKFWLLPTRRLAHNNRFRPHEITEIQQIIAEHHELLVGAWHEFFGH